jgi:hypothetical protein
MHEESIKERLAQLIEEILELRERERAYEEREQVEVLPRFMPESPVFRAQQGRG